MKLFFVPFLLLTVNAFAQTALTDLKPVIGELIDKSPEGEKAYYEQEKKCEEILAAIPDSIKRNPQDKEIQKLISMCSGDIADYWDVFGLGCSWYCAVDSLGNTATSALKPQKGISYNAENIHDLNYKTAWVEGVPGYGIGEKVSYHFPPQTPRITDIIIINGYVKSEKAWKENSRVKTLKMYLNEQQYALLHLEDSRNEQHFSVEPIGNANREDWEKLSALPWWSLTFEIMDVYPGEKYDDTAITEIYFDGVDSH